MVTSSAIRASYSVRCSIRTGTAHGSKRPGARMQSISSRITRRGRPTRPGEFLQGGGADEIDVLVTVADPVTPPAEPLALDVVVHQRHLPHLKHVGEIAKTRFLRRAAERGFDDAAFSDPAGHLSEATIWNLAFWDGRTVTWPEAPVLHGITMQIVERRLAALGVDQVVRPVGEVSLRAGLAGVVMNSWSPGVGLARIADTTLEDSGELVNLLHDAYESEPPVAV